MDRYLALEAFVRVAEAQGFAEAARQLRVSRSVISERVHQLEQFVGTPLFHRSTRSVKLSEFGQSFLREAVAVVGRTNELVDQMREVTTSPIGRLRVHALPGLVLGHLARLLFEFQQRYPKIELDIVVNDAAIDPVQEGFDCALQIFPPRSEELVGRRLFPVRRVFCATPDYLERHGTPTVPADLLQHRIGWYSRYPTRERVELHRADERVAVELKPTLLSNSVHLLQEYALEHAAVACLPTIVASPWLLRGELVVVLPEYTLNSFWLSVFYAQSARSALKLKLFLDALTQSFASTPTWDAPLVERGLVSSTLLD
jgi:DNA-binding transcriptional LysR family regulator